MPKTTHHIAHNRFGLGVRPNQPALSNKSTKQWLSEQLAPLQYPNQLTSSSELIETLHAFRQLRKNQKSKPAKEKTNNRMQNENSMQPDSQDQVKHARKAINRKAVALQIDTLRHAINTTHSFQARLLDFFSNHFSVSGTNINMRALAPTLEREAIAPHLSGQFADLLIAVEQHPAMQIYLNNNQSIGPDSKVGQKRNKGLNENLGREILELHTLGVDGGYQQQDVRELAKAITGWTVNYDPKKSRADAGFFFKAAAHQPGTRTILGKAYKQNGIEQGEQILKDLAAHPATAQHLSAKLARHFISDEPNAELVSAMAKQWHNTNGNLSAVLSTMIEHPASWKNETKKYKTPREFLISAFRACELKIDGDPDKGPYKDKALLNSLTIMGQTPFNAGSPAGYGDTASDWDGAEALISRIEWVDKLTQRVNKNAVELADTVLGDALTKQTRQQLQGAESRQQALALLLLSPEFLYR